MDSATSFRVTLKQNIFNQNMHNLIKMGDFLAHPKDSPLNYDGMQPFQ